MKNKTSNVESTPAVAVQRLVRRPADATHDGLRKCLHWLDECRKLGWAEDVMPNLEAMFWQYYDRDGNKKPQNEKLTDAGTKTP